MKYFREIGGAVIYWYADGKELKQTTFLYLYLRIFF